MNKDDVFSLFFFNKKERFGVGGRERGSVFHKLNYVQQLFYSYL